MTAVDMGYAYECSTCDERGLFHTMVERMEEINNYHREHDIEMWQEAWPG